MTTEEEKRYQAMLLLINTFRIYNYSFCHDCGNYLYSETNKNIRSIICLCNRIPKIFENYRNFIDEIPEDYSGDELEDYIETPETANKNLMKHIYEMVLFGITYKKDYYNKFDDNITNKIIEYAI